MSIPLELNEWNKKNTSWIKYIFYFFLFIPHIKPGFINTVPVLDLTYSAMKFVSFAIVFFVYLKLGQISKLLTYVFLFKAVLLIGISYNSGDYLGWIISTLSLMTIVMIIEIAIKFGDIKILILTMLIVFELFIFINFLTILIFPEGLYERRIGVSYFLGGANVAARFIVPAIFLSMIYAWMSKGKLTFRVIVLSIVSVSTFILTWSMTALLGFCVISLFIIFSMISLKFNLILKKILHYRLWLIGTFTFFILIVVMRIQDYFYNFIVSVLQKDLTFTGRTYLWGNSITWIKQNFITGWGMEYKEDIWLKIGNPNGAHNYYLDLLYRGGILHFSIFMILVVMICERAKIIEDSLLRTIIYSTFCSYFIMWLFEPFYNEEPMTFIVFCLAYNFKQILNYKNCNTRIEP